MGAHKPADPSKTRASKKSARHALVEAMESHGAECRRVSRILHDDVGPILGALGFQLDALRYDVPAVAERTLELQAILATGMERVRALSQQLSDSPVDRAGLRMALEQKIEKVQPGFPGRIAFAWRTEQRLNGAVALAFYDVAALALENAVEHSGASRIKVTISGKRRAILEIRDNGRGFTVSAGSRAGLGILRMQAAARRIGATFLVESVAGRSTIVTLLYAPTSTAR